MGADTGIQWTDATFNPWLGCQKVSQACDHCYAEAWAKRSGRSALWQGDRRRTTASYWNQPLKWDEQATRLGIRRRVFCASLADAFDNQVPNEWRADLWALIEKTPKLDWQMLTKRPQNIAKMLPANWGNGWSNVWLGTTVESPTEAARRIPHLQTLPAAVRFLSCEPLLQPIKPDLTGISWLICGGESGGGARDMQPAWAEALRDQCAVSGVAFFMKQMSRKLPIPDGLLVREFPLNAVGEGRPSDMKQFLAQNFRRAS